MLIGALVRVPAIGDRNSEVDWEIAGRCRERRLAPVPPRFRPALAELPVTQAGPYDHAFARFGTMFFEMPGAAMRNIRRALVPGGTFTQIVWRRREENPWAYEAEQVVKQIVPVVSHEDTDQVHCGPGPFSMAGPDMVSTMLRAAGFARITFERRTCPRRRSGPERAARRARPTCRSRTPAAGARGTGTGASRPSTRS